MITVQLTDSPTMAPPSTARFVEAGCGDAVSTR
jgi:hypothetical protein